MTAKINTSPFPMSRDQLHGTVTGRWAGRKPEFQDPNWGKSNAPKEDLIFEADYQEMEERILGMMSDEERAHYLKDPYSRET